MQRLVRRPLALSFPALHPFLRNERVFLSNASVFISHRSSLTRHLADTETGIDALCFMAGNINDHLLQVTPTDAETLDEIAKTVAHSLDVDLLRGAEMAQLIWVLEVVERETPPAAPSFRWGRLTLYHLQDPD